MYYYEMGIWCVLSLKYSTPDDSVSFCVLEQVYGRDEKSGTIYVENRDMCMVSGRTISKGARGVRHGIDRWKCRC